MTRPPLNANTTATAIVTALLVVTMIFAPDHFAPPTGLMTAYDPRAQVWLGESGLKMDTTDVDESDKAYTAAFWSHFTRHYPGTKPLHRTADGRAELPGPAENTGWLAPETQVLYQVDPAETINASTRENSARTYKRDVIRLRQAAGPGPEPGASDTLIVHFDDATHPELLDIWVIPPNTYTKDTGDALDPATCGHNPSKPKTPSPCEVDRAVGPHGEEFRHVTGHSKLAEIDYEHDKEPGAERFVVLYREDGSAVVVRDAVETKRSKNPPSMSFTALAELALALPLTR